MTHSRVSLAALSALSASALLLAGSARRNTAFTDYTGADPVIKKFTLNADDDAAGPGAEHAPNADAAKAAIDELVDTNIGSGAKTDSVLGTDTGQSETLRV